MYDLEDKLLKLGYYAPSVYYGGPDPSQQPQKRGLPWGKLALTGLLGAGAAYGIGKYNPEGIMGGFAKGVDTNVINPFKDFVGKHLPASVSNHLPEPVKNFFGAGAPGKLRGSVSAGAEAIMPPTPEMEGQTILNNANAAADIGQFSGIKNDSQLHGTEFYQPGKLEGAANVGEGGAALAGGAALVGTAARGGARMLAPGLTAAAGNTAIGAGLSTGINTLSKVTPYLGAAMTVPDSMQLGAKMNDRFNIKDRLARGLVTSGTVGLGIAGALKGAALGTTFGPVGTVVGGTIGAFAPKLINGVLNRMNRNKMLNNGMTARAAQLKTDFQRGLLAKQQGNDSILKGWYGTQTPAQLDMTMNLFKSDPAFRQQIQQYNPSAVLSPPR